MAQDSSFYMSFPNKPVYLKPWNGKRVAHSATSVLARFTALCIIDPLLCQSSGDADSDTARDKLYVRSCLSAQSLFRRLLEQKELSSGGFEFVLGAKTSESGKIMRRQLYVLSVADVPKTAAESINLLAHRFECAVWVYEKDTGLSDSSVLWRLRDCHVNGTARPMPDVLEESDQPPDVPSPIFRERCFSPVFLDHERAMKVLGMVCMCCDMSVFVCICVHARVRVCIHVCARVSNIKYLSVCVCLHIYIYMCVCVYVCFSMGMYLHVCINVCFNVCVVMCL